MTQYDPSKAWLRASIYFATCIAIGWASGTLAALGAAPLASDAQINSGFWWLATVGVTSYVVFAYFFFWPKGTLSHGRPLRAGYALLFGFLWGACQGLLMLSVFRFIQSFGLDMLWTVLIMFTIYATFSGLWQSLFWDVYVSPEHNIAEWNLRKVLVCHVPFLILALLHLAVYQNAAIFILWQVMALVKSSWVMRFPAPNGPV
jgi:hypothetical protein